MIADSAPKAPDIDPTLNVKEAQATAKSDAALIRQADLRYSEMVQNKDFAFHNAMREAETRRMNDLNGQKSEFDRSQADLLRLQVSSNAKLVSDQLDRMTTVLSDRIAKLEQFRYESSGKGSGASVVIGYVLTCASIAIAVTSVAIVLFRH